MKRLFGWYLIVVGIAVGLQFFLEFTYDHTLVMKVWFVLDWFSVVGYAICLYASFRHLRESGDDVWSKMSSHVVFYVSFGLALAFTHNFLANIFGNHDDLLFWKFINIVQVPLFLAIGWRLR